MKLKGKFQGKVDAHLDEMRRSSEKKEGFLDYTIKEATLNDSDSKFGKNPAQISTVLPEIKEE